MWLPRGVRRSDTHVWHVLYDDSAVASGVKDVPDQGRAARVRSMSPMHPFTSVETRRGHPTTGVTMDLTPWIRAPRDRPPGS